MLNLHRATPESRGISSAQIHRFIDHIEHQQIALHSFMLSKGNAVIAEAWWDPYQPDIPHELFSLSKSFTAIAVGFAIDDGLFRVNDYVTSFFPDSGNDSVNLKRMKIKHLLSMNTGHTEDTTGRIMESDEPWVQAFLKLPVPEKPGTHFLYNTGASYMLSAIVQRMTGMPINDYLDQKLYQPLGIRKPYWGMCPQGINLGGFGLRLTTEDILKFSILLLNKGRWEHHQLISPEWIEESYSLQSDNNTGEKDNPDWQQGYGYQLWRCRHRAYRGDGAFGQYCIVMPDQDATIAITAGYSDMQGILDRIWDDLLPYLSHSPLSDDPNGYQQLMHRLDGLHFPINHMDIADPLQSMIDGRVVQLDENILKIQSIAFDFNNEGCAMKWTFEDETASFQAGHGHRISNQFRIINSQGPLEETLISGTWTASHQYQLDIFYLHTPLIMQVVFTIEDDGVSIRFSPNIDFGKDPDIDIHGHLIKTE